MQRTFLQELRALGLPRDAGASAVMLVTQADLAALPEAVRRYYEFMGVMNRPRDWSFSVGFTGRFRTKADGPWLPCEAWQYNSRLAVARVFHIRIRMAGVLPVLGRDTYLGGRGRMLVRLLDLVTVADGTGEEFDIGELVTYLNDGIMIAPSMLLVPEVRWTGVDANTFDVALSDHGHTVTARVSLDARGAPADFSTTDRFYTPTGSKARLRTRWTTPIEGWQVSGGRCLWTRGQAIWHLPEGPVAYADFTPVPGTLAFNVPPGG